MPIIYVTRNRTLGLGFTADEVEAMMAGKVGTLKVGKRRWWQVFDPRQRFLRVEVQCGQSLADLRGRMMPQIDEGTREIVRIEEGETG